MTGYFFDHGESSDKTKHAAINSFFRVKNNFVKLTDIDDAEKKVKSGEIVFVHTMNRDAWINYGNRYTAVEVVFMSTNPDGLGTGQGLQKNFHICKYKADELEGNGRIVEFLEKWKNNISDWSLLAPLPYPENLVAFYLAEVAKSQNVVFDDTVFLNGIETQARVDYSNESRAHGHNMDFSKEGIRALFIKISKSHFETMAKK